jgi:hypothetical protein
MTDWFKKMKQWQPKTQYLNKEEGDYTYFWEQMYQAFKSRLLDELHVTAKMTPEEYEQWKKQMVRSEK